MTTDTLQTTEERIGELHAILARTIFADPSILEEIPNEAGLVLIPAGADDDFIEANIVIGLDALRKGRSVYFKRLAPGEWGIGSPNESAEHEPAGVEPE